MGWLDGILGKKEEPKAKPKTKKEVTAKKESGRKKVEQPVKKQTNQPKLKPNTTWTKGKLDKLSTVELHKVAKEHSVKIAGLTKTQIYSAITKGN